jgi:hypothetical protein
MAKRHKVHHRRTVHHKKQRSGKVKSALGQAFKVR